MAQAKKPVAKKPKAKKSAPKKTSVVDDPKNVLPEFLKASAKGWRHVQEVRLQFAQENVNEYFETMKSAYAAKDFAKASEIRSDFAMNSLLRQIEQAREINHVAGKARRDAIKVLGVKLPTFGEKAA